MHFSCIFSINRYLVAGKDLGVRGFKSSVINYLNDTLYKPSKIYLNADKDKEDIIIENKNKSGVYCWINKKKNGNKYVGSSVNLTDRFYDYFNLNQLINGSNKNAAISKALVKYGYSDFKLEILEYCDRVKCTEREQYYMDLLKPEYNILKIAGSSLGFKHSEETRAKISESGKGKIISELTKAKMSESQKAVDRLGKIILCSVKQDLKEPDLLL